MDSPQDATARRSVSGSSLSGAYGFRRIRGRRTQVVELPAEDQYSTEAEEEPTQRELGVTTSVHWHDGDTDADTWNGTREPSHG
jgi:hypothetical protein